MLPNKKNYEAPEARLYVLSVKDELLDMQTSCGYEDRPLDDDSNDL